MQVVGGQQMFDEAKKLHMGIGCDKDLPLAEAMYNDILNHNIGTPYVLYALAMLIMEKGHHGLAIALFEGILAEHPKFGEAWNNLGIAWMAAHLTDRADECFARAIECVKEFKDQDIYADALCNRAGGHLNRGKPALAVQFCKQVFEVNPDHMKAKWHMAMALLELQQWDEAWDWHESRLKEGSADHNIAERNYAEDGMTPWWDGKSPGLIVIHGEQGLGDEIMFSSCIEDMRGEGRKFVFEPSPRTHNLFKHSFRHWPDIEVHGSHATDGRDWIDKLGRPDFKIALGSLPKFCRRKEEDFPGTPFLTAPPVTTRTYAKRLHKLGPKPKIGIAWFGGVQSTAMHLRSIFPKELAPILEQDADFISLQYTADAVSDIKDAGIDIHHWPEAVDGRTPTGKDIGHLAALISNLDLVCTVCQTAVHIAGALGVPCLVLTPSRPSWRYGVTGNMPWYSSVDLIRQEDDDWDGCIQEAADRLRAFLAERMAA